MADFPGLTFSPLGGPDRNNPNAQNSNAPAPYAPIQDAIRTLSFHIPKFGGASSPIPTALLNGAGSGGLDVMGLLRTLFGLQPGAMGGGSAPIPNVHPGTGGPPTGGPPSAEGTPLPKSGPIPNGPPPGTFNPGGYGGPAAPSPMPNLPDLSNARGGRQTY